MRQERQGTKYKEALTPRVMQVQGWSLYHPEMMASLNFVS